MGLEHRRRMATRRLRTGRVVVGYRRGVLIVGRGEGWPWRQMRHLHRPGDVPLWVHHG